MRCTMGAAWTTMIAPVKSAVTTTMGSDSTPILYMFRFELEPVEVDACQRPTMRPARMPICPAVSAMSKTLSRAAAKGDDPRALESCDRRGGHSGPSVRPWTNCFT